MKFEIENSWSIRLKSEFNKAYFLNLVDFLMDEYRYNTVYPPSSLIFNAFNSCKFDDLKVVIIGQDPYHRMGQAHGLSFSVPDSTSIPPSLRNIYKEITMDLGISVSNSGNLIRWSKQGVLLLNSILTVRGSNPGSHKMKGWEIFTDYVISLIQKNKKNIVFILWGAYAHKKGLKINRINHLIIESSHPSPFSAHKGFFGSKPFSKCNEYLRFYKKNEINW